GTARRTRMPAPYRTAAVPPARSTNVMLSSTTERASGNRNTRATSPGWASRSHELNRNTRPRNTPTAHNACSVMSAPRRRGHDQHHGQQRREHGQPQVPEHPPRHHHHVRERTGVLQFTARRADTFPVTMTSPTAVAPPPEPQPKGTAVVELLDVHRAFGGNPA